MPRRCSPQDGSSLFSDGMVSVEQSVGVGYRLYINRGAVSKEDANGYVLLHFHGNAELCTDLVLEVFEGWFCKGRALAVFCPDYRGYGWSEGSPQLSRLCPDAEA